jgi:hypothetical protein
MEESTKGEESQGESALIVRLGNVRVKNTRINGPVIRQKAEKLNKTVGKETFSSTNGWCKRWKTQQTVVLKRMHGAEKSAEFFSN